MPRSIKVYVEDMLESSKKAISYVGKMSFEDFQKDEKTFDAVVRNLEVIGEAAKAVSESTRSQYPEVEWKKMAGMGDMLVHVYFGADQEVVIYGVRFEQ